MFKDAEDVTFSGKAVAWLAAGNFSFCVEIPCQRVLVTDSLTRSLTHSLTHSLTRSLARSLAWLSSKTPAAIIIFFNPLDPNIMKKSGRIWIVAELAKEYGFKDVGGMLVYLVSNSGKFDRAMILILVRFGHFKTPRA